MPRVRGWLGAVSVLEVAFLAAVAAGLTWAAWRLYPAWDDGWLWLQRLEGDESVRRSLSDRPVLGWLWASLGRAGLLLPLSVVAHGAGWLSLALVTRDLWRRTFPALRHFGFVAGLLAVGTTLLEIQWVLINPVWSGLVGVALVFVALLILDSAKASRSWAARWGGPALAVSCVVVAALLSEYGVLAAVVVVVFLWVGGSAELLDRRAMRWRGTLLILAPACAAYALFLGLADPSQRPDTRPEQLLHLEGGYLLALPFIVATELWQGVAGNLLSRLGAVEIKSLESLLIAVGSSLASFLVAYGLLPGASIGEKVEEGRGRREVWALLAAGATGVLAMTAAGRVPGSGLTSRFYLPVAPLLACLTLWVVLKLGRPRFRRILGGAVVLLVLFSTAGDARAHLVERQRVASLAAEIAPHLDPHGFNLIVLLHPGASRTLSRAPTYELTARMAQRLDSRFHRRLWVVRYEAREREGVAGAELIGVPRGTPELVRHVRGLRGRVGISRVVWVEVDKKTSAVRIGVSVPGEPGPGAEGGE